ncbi:Macrolide export ATP-binding/permease protein MacB [Ephemeroptericola cinctiostellae]|uniref:Pyoverdine export ATP-binding/permease protein PvdT n=1 Tax=Ephemeroptericola cinctiostellae TaxID=2268024 RepID=A0A345DA41_9BURK|nr:MacB family efflux pump subunit [Ephemeroptericola cinctiostellae]AXF85229.1 Macrolide export ATP-binding/permease protein MacB [Ephemeroptericola cinctiostellae]
MSTSSAHATPSTPLMEVRGLYREFSSGDDIVAILKNINLTVNAGEMIAIIGASGSGKSTLMNILGCLDKPTRGSYTVNGQETGDMLPDELAQLRREYFGFIFQRYHLLGDLTALGNAEIPAIYAGFTPTERHARTQKLLERLGLGERMGHKPGQLSGGQQQRVSIARALVNGGEVILADEPTGALDSNSGREVMAILRELHAEGHTIIIVTHDAKVAENADRIIEISDGEIIADRPTASHPLTALTPASPSVGPMQGEVTAGVVEVDVATADLSTHPVKGNTHHSPWRAATERFREAFSMAVRSMLAHRMRSFLTMLGIIIGIASVVSVVALGAGSQQQILKNISSMGTNTIDVYPGTGFGDRKAGRIRTLNSGDADVLAQQSYVNSVTPGVSTSVTVRYQNISVSAQVKGVGEQYFQVKGVTLAQGKAFDVQSTKSYAQEIVIDDNTKKALFLHGENPIGQVIVLGNMPSRIIGVAAKSESAFGNDENLSIFAPYTTVMGRMLGQNYLKSITVRVSDSVSSQAAEEGVTKILTQRHGSKDFFISNSDSIRKTIEQTTQTMTLLVSMIAVISLIVGGIGVMNIMLVSVTERTQEIGVRMAVGARQSDILQQFLIEAVVICLLGGVLGIALSLLIGEVFSAFSNSFTMVYSTTSIVAAFACSTLIGVLFGFLPARNAARLDPVVALTRE